MAFHPTICITDISNHLPLVLNLENIDPYKAPKTKIQTRKLDSKKMTTLNNKINETNWTKEMDRKDANDSFNTLHKFLSTQLNEIAPVTTVKVSGKK